MANVEENKFDHLLREEGLSMWYFSWVLGVGFAVSFSIINAMWLEQKERDIGEKGGAAGGRARRS